MRYTFLVSQFETRVRVRYAETDQMGVVYHANYLVWMEVARVAFCRSIGIEYREMEREDGIVIAVIEAHCRYVSPARFDDEVAIGISIKESTPRLLRFRYELAIAVDGRKVATGETLHFYLSRETFRPIRLPEKYHGAFKVNGSA